MVRLYFMEQNINEVIRNIQKSTRNRSLGAPMSYNEAMEEVSTYLERRLEEKMQRQNTGSGSEMKTDQKTKAFVNDKKKEYREYIHDAVLQKNIHVRGYEGDAIEQFVEEMVSEFAGYSVLEDAFADPEISDIYLIDDKTIFVEKAGENVRYTKTFRDEKHYMRIIQRFIKDAGKELNIGDKKIVDFEIFQDRGCATSTAVSPKACSMTIRKHPEDHLTRSKLIAGGVMNEDIADLTDMFIDGECNIIYAGLTGSGKTTSLRAMIDDVLMRNKKRAVVIEDTQEMFLKAPHVLELVSFKDDNPSLSVPLHKLIVTGLRLKPKYLVVGEVRGVEAEAMVEGMETGHATLTTMHANRDWDAINRLVTKYLMQMPNLQVDVVERIIGSAVDFIYIQDNVPGVGRRVTSISEVGYDFDNRKITLKNICKFNFKKNDWDWFKDGWIIEDKIDKMLRRGVPLERLEAWERKAHELKN